MITTFQNYLRRLRRHLTATNRYKQLLGGVATPVKSFGRNEWVLSRALYRFSRFDLTVVPRHQRSQALDLQIRQWSPFAHHDAYRLWDKDCALVWAWDADRINFALTEHNLKPKDTRVIPESLLHERQSDGAYLVTCLDGFEGQVWSDRALTSSRWWPAMPRVDEWVNFQRDAATLPGIQSSEVPVPRPMSLEEKPWAKSENLNQSSFFAGQGERWVAPVIALGLFAASMWYGIDLIKLRSAISVNNAELAALTLRAEPIMRARAQALESLSRANVLQSLDPYPSQMSLMGKVAESLPKDGTYLKEWEFVNGRLRLLITSPIKPVSSEYIKLFQSLGIFKNVQVTSTNDTASLMLNMDVLPQAEAEVTASGDEVSRKENVIDALHK